MRRDARSTGVVDPQKRGILTLIEHHANSWCREGKVTLAKENFPAFALSSKYTL